MTISIQITNPYVKDKKALVIIKNPLTDEETMRLEYGEGTHHHCVHSGSYLEIREIDVVDPSVESDKAA